MQPQEKPTRWDALQSILLASEKRKAIGVAWPLYFYLVFRLDYRNQLVTNFGELAEELKEKSGTLKKWKERLVRRQVVSNKKVKHGFALSLLPPYDSPSSALKDDIVELRLRSDVKTRNMLKMVLGADYLVLLPILAALAQRAIAGDLLAAEIKGTGYGVLASLNRIGDLFSSFMVGTLLSTGSSVLAFGYCLALGTLGTLGMLRIRRLAAH